MVRPVGSGCETNLIRGVGLLRAVDRSPLVVTRRRNNATTAFESGAKHRLLGDGFAAGVNASVDLLSSAVV
jgi:hypothetical protein